MTLSSPSLWHSCFLILLGFGAALAEPAVSPKGLWPAPRKDARNQARADVSAKMKSAPREVWRRATGGAVGFARSVRVGGDDAALVLVGNNLELRRWSGKTVWRNGRLGVGSVLHVGDFDGRGGDEVCVTSDSRTVVLLDIETGREVWRWQSEPSSFINGYKFYRTPTGIRFICFPSYSLNGYCFDFSAGREQPRLLWQRNYEGKYGTGYGPNIILKDMDGDGRLEIVLSGKIPRVYQAILDIDTGVIKSEVYYDPEPGSSYPVGRPYGLLHAVAFDPSRTPDVVMICCQVEEYIGVARGEPGGKLSKLWGKFIEKDWPEDHLELRPQITSFANLQGTGVIEMVIGVWDGKRWQTLVIDPRKGYETRRGSRDGEYFWGCHDLDGDGVPEIIVSREAARRTARSTTLLALSGKTLQPVATLENAAVFASTDSLLADDVAFGANRHNPVYLRSTDGAGGILVRRFEGEREIETCFWGARRGVAVTARRIAGPGFDRADVAADRLLLSDGKGEIQRFGGDLRPVGTRLVTSGRFCRPLAWAVGTKRELIVDVAGDMIEGGVPDLKRSGQLTGAWRVPGGMPAAHLDARGQGRLVAADTADSDHPAALIYTAPIKTGAKPRRIALDFPPYLGLVPFGDQFHLLVNLQTGVHTMALAQYDAAGRLEWKDTTQGAHPRLPAAADLDGDGRPEVIADDHGVLRVYDPAGKVTATDKGWPPAYTLPIVGPFGPAAGPRILRASGMSGIALMDREAKNLWQTRIPNWRHYGCLAAVADPTGRGEWAMGSLAEDGLFECMDLATGKLRWSLDLHTAPSSTSVVAGDLDGDGGDEFLLGLPDGRLLCLQERAGQGTILWQVTFDAAVANPIIADVDGDGAAEILLSTSDGYVRILKG